VGGGIFGIIAWLATLILLKNKEFEEVLVLIKKKNGVKDVPTAA
jgi:hypothetical protein